MGTEAEYGNWVSAKSLYLPGLLCLLFGGLAILLPLLSVVAVAFFLVFLYSAYARHLFSHRGGRIQARVQELLLGYLDWDGRGQVLDIGCGGGLLSIEIAKRYPEAQVTGIDCWGEPWGYSKSVCERNAQLEGVAGRVAFRNASAAALPFADETFDLVVSNLVFHEVRDIADKREAVREALRVVKKGGRFVLQDLFLWQRVYGDADSLLETIKSWGIDSVELVNTSEAEFIPRALKLPFMLGTISILRGRK